MLTIYQLPRPTPPDQKGNKQRLVKMTAKEEKAGDHGLNVTLVYSKVMQIPGLKFGPGFIEEYRDQYAIYLSHTNGMNIEPRKVRQQAHQTAAVIRELQRRIRKAHPLLRPITRPALSMVHCELLERVAQELEDYQPQPRSQVKARDELLAATAKLLLTHLIPTPTKAHARIVAVDVLAACGISAPTDERELRRRAR